MTLRELRDSRNLRQCDVAESLKIDRAQLSRIEKNGVRAYDLMQGLARVYGVSVDEIAAASQATRNSQSPVLAGA